MKARQVSVLLQLFCVVGPFLVGCPFLVPAPPTLTGRIQGTVTDAETAQPIASATVVQGTSLQASTDATGHYAIANVSAGSYVVVATASGYQPQNTSVTVSASTSSTVNFSLTPIPGDGGGAQNQITFTTSDPDTGLDPDFPFRPVILGSVGIVYPYE